jgi:hypothetical protein
VQAATFWTAVTMDRVDMLDQILSLLATAHVRFCAIGGVAVNAYVEPVVTLDLEPGARRRPESTDSLSPGKDLRDDLDAGARRVYGDLRARSG